MKSHSKIIRKVDTDFALSSLIYKQKSCQVCSKKHNQAKMILCDRCEDAFHIKCIKIDSIPAGTWICRLCMVDINQIKQGKLMSKRPVEKASSQECASCNKTLNEGESFEFEGDDKFQARYVSFVICTACQQKFHSPCFSKRPQAINCTSCEKTIRENIPKGHTLYMQFLKESRAKIAHLNYMELIVGLESSENMAEYGCMQSFQLVAPAKPKDWRVIAAYQASLCYALMTRGMIYCENLVLQMKADRFQTILKGHKSSVEKIYRLQRTDQLAYQQFKSKLQDGYVPALEVKQDRKKGFYMVSTDYTPANTIIAEYTGELITARESLNMISNESIFTLIRNPKSSDSLDIAPSRFANVAIFISGINNADTAGCQVQNVRALKFMYKGIARLILCTSKEVKPNQTLYLNYNGDRAVSQYPTASFVH